MEIIPILTVFFQPFGNFPPLKDKVVIFPEMSECCLPPSQKKPPRRYQPSHGHHGRGGRTAEISPLDMSCGISQAISQSACFLWVFSPCVPPELAKKNNTKKTVHDKKDLYTWDFSLSTSFSFLFSTRPCLASARMTLLPCGFRLFARSRKRYYLLHRENINKTFFLLSQTNFLFSIWKTFFCSTGPPSPPPHRAPPCATLKPMSRFQFGYVINAQGNILRKMINW